MELKEKIKRLTNLINRYNEEYYIENNPTISDHEYDKLYKELVELEKKYPQHALDNSPTKIVGAKSKEHNKEVTHNIPMLSLENSYTLDDVKKFVEKVLNENSNTTFSVEPKMDGAAVSITYTGGIITVGATRGDGKIGENITENVKKIKNIPMRIDYNGKLTIRGEVFMPKEDFNKINAERAKNDQIPFANARNATAGSLKLLDSSIVETRGLHMYVYGVEDYEQFRTHSESLDFCKKLLLPINPLNKVCKTYNEIVDELAKIEDIRYKLPYDIDGAVIKVNEVSTQNEIGSTGKYPKWAIAYKYNPTQETTILRDVIFQVGRTGTVTPVAILDPVLISGSTVSRATLHNEDEIKRLDIMIGDTLFIEKGGEIIPKVVKVVTDKRPNDAKYIVFPQDCPECGTTLIKIDNEVRRRCPNPECKARVKAKLIHFASRNAMAIDGLGESLINSLVDEGRLRDYIDIFTLSVDELQKREKMGEKSANNIVTSIAKSKEQPFVKVLFALGLPGVGINTAQLIVNHFKSMDKILDAKIEEFVSIKDIGLKTAATIMEYMKEDKFIITIKELEQAGLKFKIDDNISKTNNSSINEKTFVITGTLSQRRSYYENLIKNAGGRILSSVSKNLDYLLLGEKAGSKMAKAQQLGIKIIDEKELDEMLRR